jgi:TonB family protein
VLALGAPSAIAAPLTAPEVTERPAPIYPEAARGLVREVSVLVVVAPDGSVREATLEAPAGDVLDDVALETAKRYRFKPATKDGVPITSKIRLNLLLEGPAVARSLQPASPSEDIEDVRVKGERTVASPTKRTLDRREIEAIPGTFGDAIRAVESLPGAARAPAFSGLIILRGSAPRDSQVFLDGMNVPLAYHFGGLTAIVPTELLDRVDLYPGNYDVEYGRGMGGIVDIGLRSPARDRPHAMAKIDMLDYRALVETPLGKHTRVLLAGRRSWFDAWFPAVANALDIGATAAPVYHDAELVFEQDLGDRATFRATALTSSDRVSLTVPPAASDPSFSGNIDNRTDFHRAQLRVDARTKNGTKLSAQTSFGYDHFNISIGKLVRGDSEAFRMGTRARVDAPIAKGLRGRAGLDLDAGEFDFSLTFPPIPVADEPGIGPLFGKRQLSQIAKVPFAFPAGWVALEGNWDRRLRAHLGLRVEGFTDVKGVAVEPRMSARWTIDPDARRKTTLKAAFGLYAQQPQFYEYDRVYGTPGIRFNQAVHFSAGIEQEIVRGVTLSVEPFAKRLFDLVSRRVDAQSQGEFRGGNDGMGFVYGTEVLLKMQPTQRFMGWVAYTISRSERRALPELPIRVFEFDQTHVLSAVGSVRLDGSWELGARMRLISGNPYTPVAGAAFDADAGAYAGLEQQPLFSSRLPPFFSLDVRIEKTFRIANLVTIRAYLDVVNVTNRANLEGTSSSFDFSRTSYVSGLPFLPNLGLRGEL